MIWIDLDHKRPTDTDIPGWTPWSKAKWDAWLAESSITSRWLGRKCSVKVVTRRSRSDMHTVYVGCARDAMGGRHGGARKGRTGGARR